MVPDALTYPECELKLTVNRSSLSKYAPAATLKAVTDSALMVSAVLLTSALAGPAALAQVDSIPDPRQDFYEQSKPGKAPDFKKLPPAAPDFAAGQTPMQSPAPASARNTVQSSAQSTVQSSGQSAPPGKAAVKAPVNDLDDALSAPDDGPRTAPERRSGEQTDAAAATGVPAVTHPELMPRPPIPTPPAVSLQQPMNGGQLKDNLAWRTRAYKLRSESADAKGGLVKAARLINGSFEDTIAAVTAACSSKGLVIDAIYQSAGQILAHPSDSAPERSRIIIAVKPISKTSTLVRIGLDTDNRNRQASFDDLLNRVDSAINEKGLL